MTNRAEQLCLTWSDFPSATWDMLRNLLFQGVNADVTLVSDEGKTVRTHQFMLQSCSSFFQSLLPAAQPNPIIYLTNIRLKEIQNLLKFMYLGQVFLEEMDLHLFMLAAEKLQIKGLHSSDFSQNSQMFNQAGGFERKEPIGKAAMADYSPEHDLSLTLLESSVDMLGPQQSNDTRPKDLQKINSKDELLGLKKEESKIPFPCDTISNTAKLTPPVMPLVPGSRAPQSTELLWNAAVDNDLIVEGLPDSQISCPQVYHHCEKCDYKSTKMFNVKKHTAAVHDGVRYPCDLCDYKATETGHLKKHKRARHGSSQ